MKTLEPLSNRYQVPVPDADYASEFEVQAEIYCRLKAAGLDVRGEVKWCDAAAESKAERRETCRFDLVIYRDRKAVEIVEVKAGRVNHKQGAEGTRQGSRYPHFGVPVTFVYGMPDAEAFIAVRTQKQ